jgi:hypothetical protein
MMSYSSRVYRQRNAHAHDESAKEPFVGKQHEEGPQKEAPSFIQEKMTVNQPGDAFEKEADAMADTVVNRQPAGPIASSPKIAPIQRLATSSEDEKLGTNDARMKLDKDIQEKPLDEANKKDSDKDPEQKHGGPDPAAADPEVKKRKVIQHKEEKDKPGQKEEKKKKEKPGQVQKKSDHHSGGVSEKVSSNIEQTAGKGSPMPPSLLNEMNHSFGFDFSDVSIHNDRRSAEMNKELHSQAFTHGKDIYFNQGKYNTDNAAGKKLLAHELTHVIQQTGSQQTPTHASSASTAGTVQAYRPKKAFNFGRQDTPDTKEDSFDPKKDKNTKPWIEDIYIVFTGTDTDTDGAKVPTGFLIAFYHKGAGSPGILPMISFPITGGKHTEMYTHAGDFTVTRIEGVGYSNTSNDTNELPHDNPKEGPNNKYDVDLNSNMSYAIFFYKGEAIHLGALDTGSHGCVHVDWGGPTDHGQTIQQRRLNYHSVVGLTKVHVSYTDAILPELCCKIYEQKKIKKGTGSNPCDKTKAQDCP